MKHKLLGSFLAVAAMGGLLSGCVESQESDVEDPDSADVAPLGPGGSLGNNGLATGDFSFMLGELLVAMNAPIADAKDPHVINAKTTANLLALPEGVALMHYAAACALPAGEYVESDSEVFKGMGHMRTTKSWGKKALSFPEQADLFTCIVTHLNPLHIHVPIVLTGIDVAPDGDAHDGFDVEEALWVTTQDLSGDPWFHVLPMPKFSASCADPESAFRDRVCGQNPVGCRLSILSPGDCEYDPQLQGWTCLQLPAIETWLQPDDLRVLNPRCVP